MQKGVEQAALSLKKEDRIAFLTQCSLSTGESVHQKWVELGDFLVMKYNDGYVKDSVFSIKNKGYTNDWFKQIPESELEKYRITGK